MTAARQERSYPPARRLSILAVLTVLTAVTTCATAGAADLGEFTSDGCSLFPDGTIAERSKWCDCCFEHDVAYWQGGTEEERKVADAALRSCVLERTGDTALAETMYLGVRAGGHPVFPTWYRWGYGWSYGRGYAPLIDDERKQVKLMLDGYRQQHPGGYCLPE